MKSNLSHAAGWLPLFLVLVLAGCASSRPAAEDDDTPRDPYTEDVRSRGIAAAAGQHVGWASTIENERDNRQYAFTEQLLHGQVAGVEVREFPGGGFAVRIRNASSFLGGTEPLYVVDGMPVLHQSGGLHWLNIRDVRKIEVIKDVGSTAIYGARGANGVVLVTTKLGPEREDER